MAVIIQNPSETCRYALEGLTQWSTRMIPTLFPFMILSSLMLYCGTDKQLGNFLKYFLSKAMPLNCYGYYAVFMGYLCGFPMGTKVVSELFQAKKLSKRDAEMLAGFCSNIGPAYFFGLIFPMLRFCGFNKKLPFLFGMYGIPFLYGIILCQYSRRKYESIDKIKPDSTEQSGETIATAGLFSRICMDNIQSMLLLGGYVTFINAMRSILDYFPLSGAANAIVSSMLEIIGGIPEIFQSDMQAKVKVFWIMTALSFQGISCMVQAISFLERAHLSISRYLLNKGIITAASLIYYALLLFF